MTGTVGPQFSALPDMSWGPVHFLVVVSSLDYARSLDVDSFTLQPTETNVTHLNAGMTSGALFG